MSSMDPTDIAKVIADAVRGQVNVLAAELNETVEVMNARVGQLDERVRKLVDVVNQQAAWVGGIRDGLDARVSGLEREAADTDEYRDWIRDEAVRLGIVKTKKKIAN